MQCNISQKTLKAESPTLYQ